MNTFIRWLTLILFAVFPLLFVYFRNEAFIFEGGLIWPLAVVVIAFSLLYVSLNFLRPQKTNNVIIVVLIACWFLLYGHVYIYLSDLFNLDNDSFRHRYFLPFYSILFLIPIWLLWKAKPVPGKLINVLSVIGLVINIQFLFPATRMIVGKQAVENKESVSEAKAGLPDVYYIILDAYTSNVNMKKYYKHDNSSFTNQLKEFGFTVIDSARSNYPYTYFSLPSSLNMEYINYFEDSVSLEKQNEDYPFKKIYHNKLASYFKSKGYRYVLFPSAYEQLNDANQADIYITNNLAISDFYQTLIELSFLRCFALEFYEHGVYNLCNNTLALLPNTPKIPGNKFVFYHCLPPHPPHVFDANGNYMVTDQQVDNRYKQIDGYVNQVKFVNSKMIETVKSILKNSANPPIIVIQGDHGSCSTEKFEDENKWPTIPSKELLKERFGILNAIYIPYQYKVEFPKDHTPVNTFRFILNEVFKDTLQILPCKSYFARYRKPYNFREVNWPVADGETNDSVFIK